MGVYVRDDSRFYWILLERPDALPIRESTKIPTDGGYPEQTKANRRAAQEAYAKRMETLARHNYQLPSKKPSRTFAEQRAWYLTNVSSHKRGVERERSMLRKLGEYFDPYQLLAITPTLVAEWKTWRKATVSASTINREEEILKHLLNRSIGEYIDANPIARQARLRTEDVEARTLTATEERALLRKASDPIDRAIILCGLDALMRRGSVAKLARAQDHGTYLTLLNAKQGTYKVPISARLRRALNAVKGDSLLYFPDCSPKDIAERFLDLCARAKVTTGREARGVTFHSLRHTGASRMLAAGVDIKTVMRIGGWKNLKVLERYLHPTDEAALAAVNLIGGTSQSRETSK